MSARNRKHSPRRHSFVPSFSFRYAGVCNRQLHFRNGEEAESLDDVEVRKVRLLALGRWVWLHTSLCVTSLHRILEHLGVRDLKDHLVPVATSYKIVLFWLSCFKFSVTILLTRRIYIAPQHTSGMKQSDTCGCRMWRWGGRGSKMKHLTSVQKHELEKQLEGAISSCNFTDLT